MRPPSARGGASNAILAEARLPPSKTIDTFDFEAVPVVSKAQIMALAAGDAWLGMGANLILFGPPGGSSKSRFRRSCRSETACRDHVDPAGDEIGGQCRQPIIVSLCPAVFDRHILSLDKAGFTHPLVERSHQRRIRAGRGVAEEADQRHRLLLRASGGGPGNRCTAQQERYLAALDRARQNLGP
jgi:hypothetical protein